MEEPLIYTSKGNLPIKDLEYSHDWSFTEEAVKFTETYKLNGEIVKESVHGFLLKGHEIGSLQGNF